MPREGPHGPNSNPFGTYVSQSVVNGVANGIQSNSVVNQTLPLPPRINASGSGNGCLGFGGMVTEAEAAH
jgi:hypothetical protein